jgi:TPR repeat protein
MALIEEGIRNGEPEAFLLKAKLLSAGTLYPQDDREATQMLMQAAKRDNIEALLALGKAYDDGKGVKEDRRKRLEAWRRAAKLGSLDAKSRISRAFTFDTFDRLMTLEEGVTWRIALYNNGYGRRLDGLGIAAANAAEMEFMGMFMGRAMEAGPDAVAEAVMNAFREAPEGLEENNLVGLGKAFPEEIKVAIERRLKKDGFYSGQPEGFWGPDVRKALADWVEGQVPAVQEASAEVQADAEQPQEATADLLSKETIGRAWDNIRAQFNAAKNDRQKRAALGKVNTLAQYGNIDARWALLPNYHKSAMVRRVVTATEITRYGLDLMVTKPPQAEKIEFEFIFNTTQIYQDGKSREFGQAVIATIRDDKRMQDALTLGGILKQFIFAPGACEAVLDAGKRAKIKGLGQEGCDDATLSALVAYAKSSGPTGIDERNRKAAAAAIEAMLASR